MAAKNWTSLFSPLNLTRGKIFFAAGKVTRVLDEEGGFLVTVNDGGECYVTVMLSDNRLLGIGCSCKEAEKGDHCKHMSAALCRLEKDYGPIYLPETQADAEKGTSADLSSGALSPSKENADPDTEDDRPDIVKNLDAMAENARKSREDTEDETVPGSHATEEYRYFDAEHFLDGLHISEELLREAKDLILGKRHTPVKITFSNGKEGDEEENAASEGDIQGRAEISSPPEEYRSWDAYITFNAKQITDSYCSNRACHYRYDRESYLERTLCRHQVAAILLARDYLIHRNPGDTTNAAGRHFLENISSYTFPEYRTAGEEQERKKDLILQPYLMLDDRNNLSLKFRIGKDKLFTIRRIGDTLDHLHHNKAQVFGQNNTLQLSMNRLTPESVAWVHFLDQVMEEEQQLLAMYEEKYRTRATEAPDLSVTTDTIPLYGAKLDHFFETARDQGSVVEINKKAGSGKKTCQLTFEEKIPHLVLEIHMDKDEKTGIFHGIFLEGKCPPILYGISNAYYLEEDTFCGITGEKLKELKPLLEAESEGYIRIRIGRLHLARFYYKVLPKLQELVEIIEYDHDEIASYLPPKPEFVSYLDVEEDTIYCRCEVYYGENVHSLTDVMEEQDGQLRLQHYRDRDSEYELAELLHRFLPKHSALYQIFFCNKNEDQVYDFLNEGFDRLVELSHVEVTDRFKRLKLRQKVKFNMQVSVLSNIMDLRISTEDLTRDELLDVLYRYKKKKHYSRLENGDYFKIDENETIEALAQLMDTLQMSPREFVEGKMQVPAYRALYLDKMLEKTQDVYINRDEHYRHLVKEFKTIDDAAFEVPPKLQETLRKYQVTGYRWLRTLDVNGFGGILADDMGLGKTLQTIAVILADKLENMERNEEYPNTTLVVCPASLVFNWGEEVRKFAPELIVSLISGSKEERQKQIENYKDVDVMITSYDLLRRDIADYEECFFRFLILDEAQYIKNHRTAAAKAAKLIKASTRFALTGTPIENRLSELWSIFDFLMPGFLYDYGTFREDFEIPIVKHRDEEMLTHLQRMITPFILRRLKTDVLKELPEKLEENYYIKMGDEQQALYDGQVTEMINELAETGDEDFIRNKLRVLAQLTRLRQICCDPSLVFEDYTMGSAKKEACIELVKSLTDGGHKALIFSQFTTMLDLLEEELKKEEISYYKIVGATPKARRLELVKAFNEDDTSIFLISLKAGGTGLNLTGADVVIHYDPWWNLAAQNQATDRAHRIGQENVVTVYKLIAKGTIEERIRQLQDAKSRLADDILMSEGVSSAELNRQELLALLEDYKKKE